MAAFNGVTMTTRGIALQAKVQAGVTLQFTRIAIGDGQLTGQLIPALNALISQKKSMPINRLRVMPPNRTEVGVSLTNQGLVTGFYFREIGLFAQDPDAGEILYGYANSGATAEFIPPGGGADILERELVLDVIVGTGANVTAIIDNSLVFVTQQELTDAIAGISLDIPDASLTVKGKAQLSSATNSSREDQAATPKAVKTAYDRGSEGVSAAGTAQTNLNTHAALGATAHGATSAATASTQMARDSAGRAKVAAPAASDDIARKDTVDAAQSAAATDATNKIAAHVAATDPHPQYWGTSKLRDNGGQLEFFTGGVWKPVGGIKSVQRGSTGYQGNLAHNTIQDFTISAVDLSKSYVIFNSMSVMTQQSNITVQLLNATTVRITYTNWTGPPGPASFYPIYWQVIESY